MRFALSTHSAGFLLLLLLSLYDVTLSQSVVPWPPKDGYFTQTTDHFNYVNQENTFHQRYLFEDKWYKAGGPIFFYSGNEGPIEGFWNNTGFMFEIAPKFNAFIIFGEHRYYGSSMPFGSESLQQPYIQYLSVDQALADFVYLLDYLKTKFQLQSSPVIAFGGSYGGMLAAYLRFKYPNMIAGSLAASSPIYWVSGGGNSHQFFEDITKDCNDVSPACVTQIRTAYSQILRLAQQGQSGLDQIQQGLRLCHRLQSAADVDQVLKWSRNGFVMMAMLDYPYAASFMASLPANPINVSCHKAMGAATPIDSLREAVGVFYNDTNAACFDYQQQYIECADITGCGLGPDSLAWDFQACTEMFLFDESNQTASDMFPSLPLTRSVVDAYCLNRWGVRRAENQLRLIDWGPNITTATNIIFSNGNLDPWHRGGVLSDMSQSVIALMVIGGAHHLDLRESNPNDPPGVITVRNQEIAYIRSWIAQFYRERSAKFYQNEVTLI